MKAGPRCAWDVSAARWASEDGRSRDSQPSCVSCLITKTSPSQPLIQTLKHEGNRPEPANTFYSAPQREEEREVSQPYSHPRSELLSESRVTLMQQFSECCCPGTQSQSCFSSVTDTLVGPDTVITLTLVGVWWCVSGASWHATSRQTWGLRVFYVAHIKVCKDVKCHLCF